MAGIDFFKEFFLEPRTIGAVAPSSGGLAAQILRQVDFATAKVIVEYGPGTGPFTKKILQRVDLSRTQFLALESNEKMYKIARDRFPDVAIYQDSAAEIGKYLQQHGATHADAIISGLPWAAFSESLQDEILDATLECLADGGTFSTFAYPHGLLVPSGQRFRKKLKAHFSIVETSPIVWKNCPPAFVYWCKK